MAASSMPAGSRESRRARSTTTRRVTRSSSTLRAGPRPGGDPIEITAYERAVVGLEEEVTAAARPARAGGRTTCCESCSQGSNPKKYGARPGFSRKRVKAERERIEGVRVEIEGPGVRGCRDHARQVRCTGFETMPVAARKAGAGLATVCGSRQAGPGPAKRPSEARRAEKKRDAVCNSSIVHCRETRDFRGRGTGQQGGGVFGA